MESDLIAGAVNEPTERVRCPVHGFIRYSKNERKIIDHHLFQRLRNVRQLAMEFLVYPGATHTRFEHSLGVMDMSSLDYRSVEIYPMLISSILYFQRKITGSLLSCSK
jgi:hypothetical protein